MSYRWKSAVLLPLLAALLGGCEPVAESGRQLPTAPEASLQALDDEREPWTVTDEEGNRYTLVQGTLPLSVKRPHESKVIGLEGGSIELAGHTLTVPEGAVVEPTLFVLGVLPNGYVQVELFALVANPLRGLINVGEQGFRRPVTLSLTYSWASGVDNPEDLLILHLREDRVAEPVPSTVDTGTRTVTAQLEHFSRYCMAMP
jgi:hypothetical protein